MAHRVALPWPCPGPPHQSMLQAWHQSTLREHARGSRNDTHKPQEPGSLPGTFRAICSTYKPCPLWGNPRSLPNPEAAICTVVTYGHTQNKARMIHRKELESKGLTAPRRAPQRSRGQREPGCGEGLRDQGLCGESAAGSGWRGRPTRAGQDRMGSSPPRRLREESPRTETPERVPGR